MTHLPVRSSDPDTSVAAAKSMVEALPHLEQLVYDYLECVSQGATSEEMAKDMGIDRVTVSPRLRPLVRKGLIHDSGKRRYGKSGRKSIVWEVTT